jgi:outer membrane protein assembly factor BamB
LSVVLVAAVQTGLEAEDWKTTPPAAAKTGEAVNIMWRFDGNGRFPNIHPPCEWSAGRNILWKTAVEIGGYSSPIVARDKVFVTAEMGSLVCLDVADGRIFVRSHQTVTLIEANPRAYVESGRIEKVHNLRNTGPRSQKGLLDWNMPVIARGRLYIRTPVEIICHDKSYFAARTRK